MDIFHQPVFTARENIPNKFISVNGLLNQDLDRLKTIDIVNMDKIKGAMQARISTRTPYFKTAGKMMTFYLANHYISSRNPRWVQEARVAFHSLDRQRHIFRPWRSGKRPTVIRLMDPDNDPSMALAASMSPPPPPSSSEEQQQQQPHFELNINRFQLVKDENLDAMSPAATSNRRLRTTLKNYNLHCKMHQTLLEKYSLLSEEQANFVKSMRDSIMKMSASTEPSIEYVLLTGHAGCGKTSTLELIPLIGYTKVKYIAITHRLCAAARKNYNIETQTFCKFLMNLLITTPFATMDFSDMLSYVRPNFFQSETFAIDIGDLFYDEYHRMSIDLEDCPPDTTETENDNIDCIDESRQAKYFRPDQSMVQPRDYSNHLSRFVNVIFLDEISMFTPGQLELFMMVFKALSTIMHEKFLLILTGDFMQIQPLFSTSLNYDRVISLCSHRFNFVAQHRITDKSYLDVVMQLTKDPLLPQHEFLHRLKQVIPSDRYNEKVPYLYPRLMCQKAYRDYIEMANPYRWLESLDNKFFEDVLPFTMFSFTNRETHYNNISMALKIYSQFQLAGLQQSEIDTLMRFATFHLAKNDLYSPIPINDHFLIPILTLIRYFPYKVLIHSDPQLVSKSIVYLLDWDLSDSKKASVTVYNPDDGKVFNLSMGTFNMNMADRTLFGIPLELFVSSTIHSSQGLTLSNDVVISLHNIDRRELFVILTRVRSSNQIKRFYDN